MARTLEVEIIGDSSSLERALGRSSRASSSFGSKLKSVGKVAGLAALGGIAAVTVGLKKSVDAAAEAEVSQKRLETQLRALGISYGEHGKKIDETLRKQSQLSAFDDEDLADSFSGLVRLTGDVNKALELNALVTDVARGKGIDLAAASAIVTKAQMGMVGSLRRQGIEIEAVTTAQDALKKGASDSAKEQAKAADLIATKQAAIAQLQEKFAGQAAAFGDTAAGAQQRFGVALENLGEVIGQKVLPALVPLINGLSNFINKAAESERLKEILSTTFHVIGVAARALATAFSFVAEMARRYWPQVQDAAERVVAWYRGTLAPAIQNVLAVITAFWDRFGSTITKILQASLGQIITIVKTVLGNMASVIQGILALIRGDWGEAWSEFKEIPGRTLRGIVSLIRGMATIFFTAMSAIGRAMIDGIVAGLSGLFDAVKNKVTDSITSALDGVKGALGIDSPSKVTAKEIGLPMAQGVLQGWLEGSAELPKAFTDKTKAAIEAARQAIVDSKGSLRSAFDTLVSEALSAFDKLSSEIETRTERKMRLQDERRAAADRQSALGDAQAQLATAVTDGDPTAILEAEKAVAEAKFQIQRAADEKRAAQERAALENRRALQRRHFEEELAALGTRLERGRLTQEQANLALIALFKKYEIPFKNAAVKLGSALAEGLREAGDEVGRQAKRVRDEIMKHLGNIQVRVNVDVVVPDRPDRRAHGGPVHGGTPYMVGERGPELFVPGSSGSIVPNNQLAVGGGGGGYAPAINLNFYGPAVGSDREFEDLVRRALYDVGRRNPGLGFSF